MKRLYIVDYWVPFPQSEYGGVINVIAENDNEAFQLLSSEKEFVPGYEERIMPNILRAQKFDLSSEYKSMVVDAFVT